MNKIKKIQLKAPIKLGDIIIKNVLNLNVDIIATRNIEKDKSK
jgi:CxxC motif-containing protein